MGRAAALRRVCLVAVLAPISVAATVGLFRPDPDSGQSVLAFPSASAVDPTLPAVPDLPRAVEAPASLSQEPPRDGAGLGVVTDARFASVDAIPGRALTAYQRAETVIRQADPTCNLTWQLIAAIGKVESNHGRFGGSLMTADGVVHPAILGPRLTGHGATSRIDDTDAGLLDGDTAVDRAVGPMQFIPSTWTVVGVDADGDGRRDPQDIDDASLATAVYLCSGTDDLATSAGQRAAVHRYNHSAAYVDLVLDIMAGYLHADPALFRVIGGSGLLDPGDYPTGGGGWPTAMPSEPQPTFDVVDPSDAPTSSDDPTSQPTVKPTATTTERPTPLDTPTASPTAKPTSAAPTATPTSSAPTQTAAPTAEPTATETATPTETATETASPTETATPTATATAGPTDGPTDGATDGPTDPGDPEGPGDPETPQVLLDAWDSCLSAGVDPADLVAMTACLVETTGLPADDPTLLALLANPPVTPPAPTQTQQQPRRAVRRRR